MTYLSAAKHDAARRTARSRAAPSRADERAHFAEERNLGFLEATVAAAALVAHADGWVTPDEKRRLVAHLRQDPRLGIFEPEEVMILFERMSQILIEFPEEGERQAFEAIARVGGVRQAKALIGACSQIAAADGVVDAEERAMAMEIAGRLRVDPRGFDGAGLR